MRRAIINRIVNEALSELCGDVDSIDTAKSINLHAGTLLAYTQRSIPNYTDHGVLHTVNVIHNLSQILEEYEYNFNEEDRLLLGVAAVVHDFGCIVDREGHAERSAAILELNNLRIVRDLLGQEAFRYLQTIVRAHASDFDLQRLIDNQNPNNRLALLCCVFRIADECDHSSERVSKLVFDIYKDLGLLDAKQEQIWKGHLAIEKIEINGPKIVVHVCDTENEISWLSKVGEEIGKCNSVLGQCGFQEFYVETRIVQNFTEFCSTAADDDITEKPV